MSDSAATELIPPDAPAEGDGEPRHAFDPIVDAEVLRTQGLASIAEGRDCVLEVGFGRADLILALAARDPGRCYLGVEVSRKRVMKAARRAARQQLANVYLVHSTAEYVVERALPDASIAECWINCPDPWPKKRHHRRRLFQVGFLGELARVLRPGAALHASTDDRPYAEWIAEALAAVPALRNRAGAPFTSASPDRPKTGYELDWIADGRSILYFEYERADGVPSGPAGTGGVG